MKPFALCLVLTAWAGPALMRKHLELRHLSDASNTSSEGSVYYLDRKNYAQVASAIASEDREIVLSTLSLHHQNSLHSKEQFMDMLRNFAYYLNRSGRLQNSIILSYDLCTCQKLLSSGILCFLDQAAPRPQSLPGQYGEGKRPHWFSKYWHAHRLNSLGYRVLFLDTDVVLLQDPFQFHDLQYDIEGLSDWNYMDDLPVQEEISFTPCRIYAMYKESELPGGQFLVPRRAAVEDNRTSEHVNPCQSTGLWFSEPTPPALAFLQDLMQWLLVKRTVQWDQAAWNELLMAHLIGTGNRPGLRHRLLQIEHFNNMPTYEKRLSQGKALDEVALHAGDVFGNDKVLVMERHDMWKPQAWTTETGLAVIAQMEQRLCGAPDCAHEEGSNAVALRSRFRRHRDESHTEEC